jgi:hypothetical protein
MSLLKRCHHLLLLLLLLLAQDIQDSCGRSASDESRALLATMALCESAAGGSNGDTNSYSNTDCDAIPIFSEQFLEHNRQREAELRLLRKNTSDLEEQNATLSKHIETMTSAIEQLDNEFIQQRTSQAMANQRLTRMRQLLYSELADTTLPGTNQLPTLPDIDSWIVQLQDTLNQLPRTDARVVDIHAKIASVLTKLDL